MAAVIAIPLTGGTASAGQSNNSTFTTTFTLACDHGAGVSEVAVSLTDALGTPDGGAILACGPDSSSPGSKRLKAELTTPTPPTSVHVESWTWTAGSTSGTCTPPDGALPYKASCGDTKGAGATLTVR
jgi:hypothetical protein